MNIGIIGRLAPGKGLLDGQTVKTSVLYSELKNYYKDSKIICVDTFNYKKNIIRILFNFIKCMLMCKHIFIILSENGRAFFVPLIYFFNILFKRKIYHDVIGGVVYNDINKNPKMLKYYNSFVVNWVELNSLKDKLSDMGLNNVEVLPNIKRLKKVDKSVVYRKQNNPLKLCTFSRVSKSKGILDAVNSVNELNNRYNRPVVSLSIYGPIEYGFEKDLNLAVKDNEYVNYLGKVDFNKSVDTLSQYDILLFPTVFDGEGFPGTLIDAFYSATPVICTDWHYNSEIVEYGKTGYYYDYKKPELLTEYIEKFLQDPEKTCIMRENCFKESEKYDADILFQKIIDKVNN